MIPEDISIEKLQNALKDGIETHNGFLMGLALVGIKQEGIHVVRSNFTTEGVEAELYYPFDKKHYIITIKEKSE